MSENEIKPVAWTSEHGLKHMATEVDGLMTRSLDGLWSIPLYDQSAIDRLTAERDAAVADAERLEWLVSNGHMRVQGRGDSWSVMDCGNGLTFACRNEPTMRAAIDAARSEGGV